MDVNRTSGDKEEDEEEESVKVLSEARHLEAITAPNTAAHSWRLKERVRPFVCLTGSGARGGQRVGAWCFLLQGLSLLLPGVTRVGK